MIDLRYQIYEDCECGERMKSHCFGPPVAKQFQLQIEKSHKYRIVAIGRGIASFCLIEGKNINGGYIGNPEKALQRSDWKLSAQNLKLSERLPGPNCSPSGNWRPLLLVCLCPRQSYSNPLCYANLKQRNYKARNWFF